MKWWIAEIAGWGLVAEAMWAFWHGQLKIGGMLTAAYVMGCFLPD